MHEGDITTKKLFKSGGSNAIVLEKDWLLYLGFSETEIENGELELVFKAERSAKHNHPFIGFGRRMKE